MTLRNRSREELLSLMDRLVDEIGDAVRELHSIAVEAVEGQDKNHRPAGDGTEKGG